MSSLYLLLCSRVAGVANISAMHTWVCGVWRSSSINILITAQCLTQIVCPGVCAHECVHIGVCVCLCMYTYLDAQAVADLNLLKFLLREADANTGTTNGMESRGTPDIEG